jgi:hypothetical protein
MAHIKYVAIPTYVLFLYIVFSYYMYPPLKSNNVKCLTVCVVGLSFVSCINILRELHPGGFFSSFSTKTRDDQLIPPEYRKTVDFLSKNLKPTETFVTLSSEASWYYFLNKPCPTRFPVVWFAATQDFQRMFVEQIEQQPNIKYVLYQTLYGESTLYGVSMERRCSIVFDYVKENFVPYTVIDGNAIWIRAK